MDDEGMEEAGLSADEHSGMGESDDTDEDHDDDDDDMSDDYSSDSHSSDSEDGMDEVCVLNLTPGPGCSSGQ